MDETNERPNHKGKREGRKLLVKDKRKVRRRKSTPSFFFTHSFYIFE